MVVALLLVEGTGETVACFEGDARLGIHGVIESAVTQRFATPGEQFHEDLLLHVRFV